jgi:uncharacterized membrane protein YkoI
MKTQLIIILALVATTVQAQKMDSKDVPATVKSGFQKSYMVKDAKWDKEGDNYEASFKQKGKEMSVVIDAKGNIIETEVEIAKSELPAAVLEVLKKDYAEFDIEEAAKITANGVITYEAEVEKGKQTFELIFDQQGKLLKKEEEKEDAKDKD